MANCCDMKLGDVYTCRTCGLDLTVSKTCACTVPLRCCGDDMGKK